MIWCLFTDSMNEDEDSGMLTYRDSSSMVGINTINLFGSKKNNVIDTKFRRSIYISIYCFYQKG